MKLADRTAIITGAAKGIGYGCARVFARYGCRLALVDRDEEAGRRAAAELTTAGFDVSFFACDVMDEAAVCDTIQSAVDKLGRLDCLVNNAGWHPPAMTIDDTSVEDFKTLLLLNLTSTFMCCKYAVNHIRETRGNIIVMSSEVGLIGQAGAPGYVSTKAGQIGLVRALALDLAPDQVRVNAVCPAGVMTPLMEEWADTQYDPQAALKQVDSWHPVGRMATSEEIGEVCAFLASSEAGFVTGQAICVDGGAALGYRR